MTKLTSLFALLFVLFTVNASAQNPGNSLQFTNQTPPVVNKPGTTTSDPMLQQRYAQQAQQAMMAYMMDSISKALSHDIDAKVNAKVTAIVGAKLKKLEAKQIKDTKSVLKTVTLVQKRCEDKIKENNDAMQEVNNSVEEKKKEMETTLTTFTDFYKNLKASIDYKFYGTWGGLVILVLGILLLGFRLNNRITLASTKYDRNMNTLMGDYNTRVNPNP